MSPPTRKTVAGCVALCLAVMMLYVFLWLLFPALRDSTGLAVLMGLVLAAAVVPTVRAWRWTTLDEREIEGRCLKCGYDLTGNVSGVCPECGTPVRGTP